MQVDASGRSSVGRRSFCPIALRVVVSATVGIVFLGLAAGCGDTRGARNAVATAPGAGPRAAVGAAPAPAASAGVDSTPPSCTTGQLKVTVGPPSGAAGSSYFDLAFTNISPRSCSLYGFSGVSFRTSAQGHQVGAAAERLSGTLQSVTLASQGRAYETLRVVNAADYPPSACGPAPVGGLQVFPPGQTSAAWVPATLEGCSSPSEAVIYVWPVAATPSG